MLAQGLKHFYSKGLHFLAPRPASLRLAFSSSQVQYSTLYASQMVYITTPNMNIESFPFIKAQQGQGWQNIRRP